MAPPEVRRRSRRSQNRPNEPRKARRLGHRGAVRHPSAAYRYNAVYAGRAAEPNAQVTTTQLAGVQQRPAESGHEGADFREPHDIGRTNTAAQEVFSRNALDQSFNSTSLRDTCWYIPRKTAYCVILPSAPGSIDATYLPNPSRARLHETTQRGENMYSWKRLFYTVSYMLQAMSSCPPESKALVEQTCRYVGATSR
ncbi:hypothetical protein TGAM01_v210231 [Trichoderma gamsii]|uniref:Uncharacterized protein n=1 Tax=Trichoderma gamsii TaxID=398673 RepID=A0A2P4Z9J7_9HYPO|nr:hypothetical protein TGAM01_v210231 [Trichoderma gamsii]PON20946.1 hypothetical protein TGAM01_v210231 [Trichoderma gamsii]